MCILNRGAGGSGKGEGANDSMLVKHSYEPRALAALEPLMKTWAIPLEKPLQPTRSRGPRVRRSLVFPASGVEEDGLAIHPGDEPPLAVRLV